MARTNVRKTTGASARPARGKSARGAGSRAPLGAVKPGQRRASGAATVAGSGAVSVAAAVSEGMRGLTEEEQIESAKYLPREMPPRVFEEERFLFPESYGKNRVRLLVKDPEWIFAYWDVAPSDIAAMRRSLGERAAALAQLTLRVTDAAHGGATTILLPRGARAWYVRTDSARQSYRVQLGLTLPSGEFRLLAESNTVTTPRTGPSPERAARKVSYKRAHEAAEGARGRPAEGAGPGPWDGPTQEGLPGGEVRTLQDGKPAKGGASDVFRR